MSIQIIKKKVKHIHLKVKPSGEVSITVPLATTEKTIAHVLAKRAEWIAKKVAFFKGYSKPTAKTYVSGEDFAYLGRHYRVKVIQSQTQEVKLQRGYIQIFVKDKDDLATKEALIKAWYMQKAKIHFEKAMHKYQTLLKKEIKTLRIRQMKTRWGSCNPSKGYINLNMELIKKPTQCIEYVVLHELAHLTHQNHSKHFYHYIGLFMPDWRERKGRLEGI